MESTWTDLTQEHWIPNHFVPVIPMNKTDQKILGSKPTASIETHLAFKDISLEKQDYFQNTSNEVADRSMCVTVAEEDSEIVDRGSTEQKWPKLEIMDVIHTETKIIVHVADSQELDANNSTSKKSAHGRKGNRVESEQRNKSDTLSTGKQNMEVDDAEGSRQLPKQMLLSDYIGKYVVVLYNKLPYPGLVLDPKEDALMVNCMKQVGKRGQNLFQWPTKNKDTNWYIIEDVMTTIPEPAKL